ncbi:MAG: CoA transferase [Brumimicrobium sp.]|nr:CoA transferase [Brumimicrobium sp.]
MTSHIEIFKELNVIDLTTVLAGPSVGTFLAELGAHVLKIENPNQPDITRSWKLPTENKNSPVSAYFASINYKKEYRLLDLTNPVDLQSLFELIPHTDILLMNFKKGDQEKLGITDKILRTKNSKLIIGKITGFGVDNDRVAYDLILQAETGFMSMNGTPDSGPIKMPVALIDVLTAHHLKEAILIELWQREKVANYVGKTVTVSLYEAAVSSLINQASNYLMTDFVPQHIGSLHPNIAPYGELFKTADKKTITFAIGTNKHFHLLCDYLKKDELVNDERFKNVQDRVKNRESLYIILQNEIKKYTSKDLFQFMHTHYVPCGEIKDLQSVFTNELAQNLIREENIDGHVTKRVSSVAWKIEE